MQEDQVDVLPAELATRGVGPIGVVHKARVDDLDAGARQFLRDATEVTFESLLESGELRPVGIEADAEQTDAEQRGVHGTAECSGSRPPAESGSHLARQHIARDLSLGSRGSTKGGTLVPRSAPVRRAALWSRLCRPLCHHTGPRSVRLGPTHRPVGHTLHPEGSTMRKPPAALHAVVVTTLAVCFAGAWNSAAPNRQPATGSPSATLRLNDLEYLEMPGLNVMLAHDYYPEGHQGGVGIIQNGLRVATNGDIRLDRTPGQWQPVPKVGPRAVDRTTQEISMRAEFPDESKNRKGFNPVEYPDLRMSYTIRVKPEGAAFRIVVDLDAPLPDEWAGRVSFNLELFPGILFGKTFATETGSGVFPLQPNGPGTIDQRGEYQIAPMATGRRLVIAPESDRQRMTIEDAAGGGLELVDGRGQHTNGWFVVRSTVARGASKGAVDWRVMPHAIPGWTSPPVVQVSQVGYHPQQQKWAVIELDRADTRRPPVVVSRISETGTLETVLEKPGDAWGRFLRFDYLRLDFSAVDKPGMYIVRFGDARSDPFRIAPDVHQRGVWQPTLEVLPSGADVPRTGERPLSGLARRLSPRRRPDGACRLQPLRRLPAGSVHAHEIPARPARARPRPRRLARRRRRRCAGRVAG